MCVRCLVRMHVVVGVQVEDKPSTHVSFALVAAGGRGVLRAPHV